MLAIVLAVLSSLACTGGRIASMHTKEGNTDTDLRAVEPQFSQAGRRPPASRRARVPSRQPTHSQSQQSQKIGLHRYQDI